MSVETTLNLSVLAVLGAVIAATWRSPAFDSRLVSLPATAALAGALASLAIELSRVGWHSDLAFTLRVCLAATLAGYVVLGWLSAGIQRLALLLVPYLLLIGVLAVIVEQGMPVPAAAPAAAIAWYDVHIALALATYALLTLAAMAGLACLLQERALKRKGAEGWTARLPSVAASEQAELRLLGGAELVLGIGIATGMGLAWLGNGSALPFDHKTVLAIGAFVVIAALLVARLRFAYRGRRAARWVLVAWLLLTLAYPGVKFVREVLIG